MREKNLKKFLKKSWLKSFQIDENDNPQIQVQRNPGTRNMTKTIPKYTIIKFLYEVKKKKS